MMSRPLTYLGLTSVLAFALVAACGANDENKSTDGQGGTGSTPGFDIGTGSTGSSDRIIETSSPQGFKNYDDGTGNPSYLGTGMSKETAQILTAALKSPPADVDPAILFDYPFADTMVPGNLSFIELQWQTKVNFTSFLLRAVGTSKTYHLYLQPSTTASEGANCNANGYCSMTLPQAEWLTMGKEFAGQTVDFEFFATDGTTVIKGAPLELRFSPEPLVGSLYYWASTNGTIKRATFGADAAVDFIVPSQNTDYACVSCHSVSRDGTKIAYAVGPLEGENIAGIQVTETSDPNKSPVKPTKGKTPFTANTNGNTEGPTDNLGHNVALNPDGSRMAVNSTDPPANWPSHLDIRDTSSGKTLFSYAVGDTIFGADQIGIHPEYSPDGKYLAVTLAVKYGSLSAWSNQAGGIAILPVNSDGSLGAAKQIVAAPASGTSYHFYPTWSPDGKYLAFVSSSDQNGTSGSLGNQNGVLRMAAIANAPVTCPGANCIELSRGTGYSLSEAIAQTGTGSTWPKFAPFAQGTNGSVYFVTFTSRRQFGAKPVSTTQLWMFGVDTSVSGDPSYSPFWLPYQELSDGSLTPYWTETVPCNTTGGVCNGCLSTEVCMVNKDENSCVCAAPPTVK